MALSSTNSALQATSPELRDEKESFAPSTSADTQSASQAIVQKKPKLPISWRALILILTCLSSFGNHWSNGLIVALKSKIIKATHINNSQFATLVSITNLVNTFLCIIFGFTIDKWGGPLLTVVLASFHLGGSIVMAGGATNNLNSYTLLIVGKVIAAVGDGSIDNAQHRILSTYFARGRGFAFSIGAIWGVANLAQFTGLGTANVIAHNLGTYAWALWISAIISLFSLLCAISVFFLDKWLRKKYDVTDETDGQVLKHHTRHGIFSIQAIRHLPLTFWIIVLFAIFENAGVQAFVSISTQFAQQRLKKGAVVGGWVSSFYLLLPSCITPFLGIFIDIYGQRVTLLFISGLTFLTSMLLLKFFHTVPSFVAAYVFYALSQARYFCFTPAPQVEIVRSVIADPKWFATAFSIKKSVVQASIVIITIAAGKLQDDTRSNSLDNAVSLWLGYAFVSVVVSGVLLFVLYTRLLPAAWLAQVKPSKLEGEIMYLVRERSYERGAQVQARTQAEMEATMGKDAKVMVEGETSYAHGGQLRRQVTIEENDNTHIDVNEEEKLLKSPAPGTEGMRWIFLAASVCVVFIGWVMFGMGVEWGVHGNVIAGTVGE